ncbi:MAG: hypothetical protein ACP5TY_00385 [Thermodesulforhabdaceae bacterium]|jgi:putative lipase involved disintegration of autophagic bodies
MDDALKKSLELEKQVKELTEVFEQGLREKERMFSDLGITPERLTAFEQKLSAENKAVMAKMQTAMEEELNKATASPGTEPRSAPKVKGMRV